MGPQELYPSKLSRRAMVYHQRYSKNRKPTTTSIGRDGQESPVRVQNYPVYPPSSTVQVNHGNIDTTESTHSSFVNKGIKKMSARPNYDNDTVGSSPPLSPQRFRHAQDTSKTEEGTQATSLREIKVVKMQEKLRDLADRRYISCLVDDTAKPQVVPIRKGLIDSDDDGNETKKENAQASMHSKLEGKLRKHKLYVSRVRQRQRASDLERNSFVPNKQGEMDPARDTPITHETKGRRVIDLLVNARKEEEEEEEETVNLVVHHRNQDSFEDTTKEEAIRPVVHHQDSFDDTTTKEVVSPVVHHHHHHHHEDSSEDNTTGETVSPVVDHHHPEDSSEDITTDKLNQSLEDVWAVFSNENIEEDYPLDEQEISEDENDSNVDLVVQGRGLATGEQEEIKESVTAPLEMRITCHEMPQDLPHAKDENDEAVDISWEEYLSLESFLDSMPSCSKSGSWFLFPVFAKENSKSNDANSSLPTDDVLAYLCFGYSGSEESERTDKGTGRINCVSNGADDTNSYWPSLFDRFPSWSSKKSSDEINEDLWLLPEVDDSDNEQSRRKRVTWDEDALFLVEQDLDELVLESSYLVYKGEPVWIENFACVMDTIPMFFSDLDSVASSVSASSASDLSVSSDGSCQAAEPDDDDILLNKPAKKKKEKKNSWFTFG